MNLVDINSRIKSLRKEAGWSQSNLAKRAGITPSAISMIESQQRTPSLQVIEKVISNHAFIP